MRADRVQISQLLHNLIGNAIKYGRAGAPVRVTLDADGWTKWSSGDRVLTRQPAKGFGQRLIEFLLNLLPLKKQA